MNHRQWVDKSNSPLLSNTRKNTHLHIDDKNCRLWYLHFETISRVILLKLILKCLVLDTILSCSLLTNLLPHHTVCIVLIYQKCEHWWITDDIHGGEFGRLKWSFISVFFIRLLYSWYVLRIIHYSWYLLPIILYFINVLP